MIHLLDDALLYLLQQNILMQYSNNRNVFFYNNRNALFQYRPTLLRKTILLKNFTITISKSVTSIDVLPSKSQTLCEYCTHGK